MISKEVLEDLSKDCPCNGEEWCFFRAFAETVGIRDREAEQIRLVFDYKYMESKRLGYDISYPRALDEFRNLVREDHRTYAEKFSDIYKEGMKNKELFKALFGIEKTFESHFN